MPLAGTKLNVSRPVRGEYAEVLLTPSGTYPTGGDPFDFTGFLGFMGRLPTAVLITGKAGFIYQWAGNGSAANRTVANQKMLVFCNTAGGANAALGEHTNIAYVAGVTGDVIVAQVWFMSL